MFVKEYHLLSEGQAIGAGKGESRGITPYGLDYSPIDGMIWYSKLNGNRIGRIDPKGFVWVCGTGNDTINRFDPKTERWVEIRLPMRVSYTREIEFDEEGNVWTSASGPSRHMERALGQVIKIEILEDQGDGVKLAKVNLTGDILGALTAENKLKPMGKRRFTPLPKNRPNARKIDHKLLAHIERTVKLPEAYLKSKHQDHVDKRMAGFNQRQRERLGRLWQDKRKATPKMKNPGHSFVKILEFVVENVK